MSNVNSILNSKGTFKKKLSAFTALLTFVSVSTLTLSAGALDVTTSTPKDVLGKTDNMDVLSGQNTGHDLDVNLNSGVKGDVGQVDWGKFDVAKDGHVNFGFSGLSQTIINRVLGGKSSEILGKLTSSCIDGTCTNYDATSKVILINPAGVMFGQGSAVDLNSFTISTFDFKNSKNLNGLQGAEKTAYYEGVLKKISPIKEVNGENKFGDIVFDAKETERFEQAGAFGKDGGLTKQQYLDGQSKITFDGATLDVDKSFAAVADQILYKDSVLKTGSNYNYKPNGSNESYSNARLVTADGVTFRYLNNGYINSDLVKDDTRNVERSLDIVNTTRRGDTIKDAKINPDIRTGNFKAINKSNNEKSDITIKDSIIKGVKLVNKEDGNIYIEGSHNVSIDNSRLETKNTTVAEDNSSTRSQKGGKIDIIAGGDLSVNDTLMMTAASTGDDATAGDITLKAGSDKTASVKGNSKLLASGNLNITAGSKVDIDNSLIHAGNTAGAADSKDINIKAKDEVKVGKGSTLRATGDVSLEAVDNAGNYTGSVFVNYYKDEQGTPKNQTGTSEGDTIIIAENGTLTMHGKDTSIDNASLVYKDLSFYDKKQDDDSHTNNVTLSNKLTFTEMNEANKPTGNINIETNGAVNLVGADMKVANVKVNFGRTSSGSLDDDKTVDAITYTRSVDSNTATNIKVTSTKNNVTSTLSNLKATNDIELHTLNDNASVQLNGTTANAGNDLKLQSDGGKVKIGKFGSTNSQLKADHDLSIIAKDTVKFGTAMNTDNVTIEQGSSIEAGNNMLVQSTAENVEGERTTMPSLKYGKRLEFNAHKKNIFSSADSLKSVNVDYVAGEANEFTTNNDIQFVDSTFKSPSNSVTTKNGDVILNNLQIKSATGNGSEDALDAQTRTKITAGGRVTTKDVTGKYNSDKAQQPHTFPQTVDVDGAKNYDTSEDTVLDVGNTKLVVRTSVPTNTNNNGKNDQNGFTSQKRSQQRSRS